MQTNLVNFIKGSSEGQEAGAVLRACVHCGFLAACRLISCRGMNWTVHAAVSI